MDKILITCNNQIEKHFTATNKEFLQVLLHYLSYSYNLDFDIIELLVFSFLFGEGGVYQALKAFYLFEL